MRGGQRLIRLIRLERLEHSAGMRGGKLKHVAIGKLKHVVISLTQSIN